MAVILSPTAQEAARMYVHDPAHLGSDDVAERTVAAEVAEAVRQGLRAGLSLAIDVPAGRHDAWAEAFTEGANSADEDADHRFSAALARVSRQIREDQCAR